MTTNLTVTLPENSDTTRALFAEVVRAWMDQRYGGLRNKSKKLARLASFGAHQVSPHTSRGWLIRKTVPSQESIEIMAARCAVLCAALEKERERLREIVR